MDHGLSKEMEHSVMWWDRAKQFLGDTSGASFVYLGMALAALTGFAGLAVDVGHWYSTQRSAQSAADSAAVAAAFEVYWGGDEASARIVAKEQAALNGFDAPEATVTVNSPPSSGPSSGDTGAVEVIIDRPTTGFFSAIFQQKLPVNIRTRAVASRVPGTAACMVALAPSGVAVEVNSGSTLDATGCAIYINSTDPGALTSNGGSNVNAEEINIAPGGSTSGSGISPPAQSAPALPDPMAYLAEPIKANDPCDYTSKEVLSDETLNPGVYCNDLKVDNNATATFTRGTYIIRGGQFLVNSGSTIKTLPGQGVTFYIADEAVVTLNSGSFADLEGAPLGEEFPGILFYQARTNSSKNLELNSDTGSKFVGVIYYPNGQVVVNSASSIGGTAPFSSIVANSIQINSASTVDMGATPSGSAVPDVPTLGAYRVSLFE